MAMLANDIFVGPLDTPLYHFDNTQLELSGAKGSFAVDVIGNELSIDTFSVVARYDGPGLLDANGELLYDANSEQLYAKGDVASPKDFLHDVPYGTEVYWFVGGNFYAKGYLKSVDRVSKNGFKLTAVSGVGLLDTPMHPGGLYLAEPITNVLASIIGGAFTYTVSQAVQNNALVYGRLPYDTKRNNLHRLLFATGAALIKSDNQTDYIIEFLSESVTDVPASRVALQGSVEYQLPSNKVEVTEHAFFKTANDPTETLFDNTSEIPAVDLMVIFDGPAYDLATTGDMTISEYGVNYAIVNGLGTLTGKYYVHTTQIKVLDNNPDNNPERVRHVTENELVTALNSRNVARRVLSYYQSAKTVKAKIMLQSERCGQLIRMTDTFGDLTQAYLAKMDTLVTSVIGAQCQLIEGYQPGNNGNFYLHRQIITENGTWTVPLDIPVGVNGNGIIKIALIQGGSGGQGGYDGEEGAYKYKGSSIFDPGEGRRDYKSNRNVG